MIPGAGSRGACRDLNRHAADRMWPRSPPRRTTTARCLCWTPSPPWPACRWRSMPGTSMWPTAARRSASPARRVVPDHGGAAAREVFVSAPPGAELVSGSFQRGEVLGPGAHLSSHRADQHELCAARGAAAGGRRRAAGALRPPSRQRRGALGRPGRAGPAALCRAGASQPDADHLPAQPGRR